ncbi:MAG: nucleoside deaminase [Alphaproteobacteria bacterium]|nr:nucleoside deaminase [Alphaproteobacteria bacterium]
MTNNSYTQVISNEEINKVKLENAKKIILQLQTELTELITNGSGPFLAAVIDENGNIISKTANSVVSEGCSNNHAEMNAIKMAQKNLGTYDLTKFNLSLYVTAEPCMMCIGGIMWSGIKNVYYGVPSKLVEDITGFDEGFKPNWFEEFKNRGITVYGNIEVEAGEKVLHNYVNTGKTVYQPER